MAQCYSCGTSLKRLDENTCRGCGQVVCVKCVWVGGHFLDGAHAKARSNKRAKPMRVTKRARVV
jgi:hypothetical protein